VSAVEWVSAALMALGSGFFLAGTVGLLRFPDLHTRLHAVTKADNLGLGLLVAGLALVAGSVVVAVKLVAIWVLALLASAASCRLIAGAGQAHRSPPAA
jgi:multicomponent Na+:H+ antiporter subunit G